MILMIDNFDSFTYNLVQYLRQLGAEVQVARNNALTVDAVDASWRRRLSWYPPVLGNPPGGRHIDGYHPHLFRTHSDFSASVSATRPLPPHSGVSIIRRPSADAWQEHPP